MSQGAESMSSRYIRNRDGLEYSNLHKLALDIVEHGLYAADPYFAVLKSVKRAGKTIVVNGMNFEVYGSVHVIGFGKASKRMAMALYEVLGDLVAGGVVISPEGSERIGPIDIVVGDHPIPGKNTLEASQRLLRYLDEAVHRHDIVFVLISGGGSALFEIPADEITLEELGMLTRELMKRGADIVELNAVRKHLSLVKGGKLLHFIKAEKVISLIVSDVVGDRLDTIASGPTASDETTFFDAYEVLKRYGLWDSAPSSIRQYIERGMRGEVPETLKQGDKLLEKVTNIIIASNRISLEAMASKAKESGFNPLILSPYIEGEARHVGKVLGAIIKSVKELGHPIPPPAAILAGGETTVTVRGSGIGGRNQELCLSLAMTIEGLGNVVAVCIGSDGIDGTSPAAGAIVDGYVVKQAREQGLDPLAYLENNDSYTFFNKLRRAIITGYTGTNVNDLFVALVC